ncbi:MAG: hypothetical protein QGG64_09345, partial [Candidatus Latescibacteria bacterium]|nr:hypothetical protein [Candidatus Latescibacterota bacterium]
MKKIIGAVVMLICITVDQNQTDGADHPLFDMQEMRNAETLDIKVLQDWHRVEGEVLTRQKLVTIRVGELWPGQDYRIPVRMIVPQGRKAKGFHLTGGHRLKQIKEDAQLKGVERDLINGGVGLVYTIVQEPKTFGQAELADAMYDRFIKTLDPHYSIQYWAWPATLMRATTAAYAEMDHFEKGKVALSGGSKNGASPSVALIIDERMTALHATVSPIWESPLRLCDQVAWDALNAFNRRNGDKKKHRFLGGNFGPSYNDAALAAGHSWQALQQFANHLADHIFISRNLEALKARGVDFLFHPGTHDYVAYDVPWGGAHYPQIPIYLEVNSGHGKKEKSASAEEKEQNKAVFLLQHFFDGVEPMFAPPSVDYKKNNGKLLVTVQFPNGSRAESGRIWW